MSEIIIKVENVQKAFREAGENPAIQDLLINLFGKENVEPEQPKDIRERIKTFEDAYDELGSNHPLCKAWDSIYQGDNDDDIKDVLAYHKLRIIVAALNEGWNPEFTEYEYRYYPYYFFYTKQEYDNLSDIEKEKSCAAISEDSNVGGNDGLIFAYSDITSSYLVACDTARIAFKNRELAEYAGQQFIDIYKDFVS